MDKLAGTSAIQMVIAFATEARLVFAQQKVDEKSNEITAIPKRAKQIIDNEGDDVLALKDNQGTLNEDVRLLLETELKKSSSTIIDDDYEETDKGHGRIETHQCYVSGENMAIIRHITLNMLNNTKKQYKNVGLKALRKKAGWGNNALSEILKKNF